MNGIKITGDVRPTTGTGLIYSSIQTFRHKYNFEQSYSYFDYSY